MLVLTADQMVRLSTVFTDQYGNAAPIDGSPRWEVSVDGIITVTPVGDGMSADVVTAGPTGMVQVRAVADAAPGAAERLIIGRLDIEVVGGEARMVTLSAAPAQPKPDAALQAAASPGAEQPQQESQQAAPEQPPQSEQPMQPEQSPQPQQQQTDQPAQPAQPAQQEQPAPPPPAPEQAPTPQPDPAQQPAPAQQPQPAPAQAPAQPQPTPAPSQDSATAGTGQG